MRTRDYVYLAIIGFCLGVINQMYKQNKESEEKVAKLSRDILYTENRYDNDMILLKEYQEAMRIVIKKYPEAAYEFSIVMDSINTYGANENE